MTDETRAELRKGIEAVLLVAELSGRVQFLNANPWAPSLHVNGSGYRPMPELTPFQQMCLSGLLGDYAQLREAVVEYLLDTGDEFHTAAYERVKREAGDIWAGSPITVNGMCGHVVNVSLRPDGPYMECEILARFTPSTPSHGHELDS